jgi:hypothetical protein
MRVRAQFTGEEYEKLMEFLRRWHDIPQSTPPVDPSPSPKRLIFSQPVAELRAEIAPNTPPVAGGQPQPAAAGDQPQPAAAPAPQPAAGALPPPVPLEPLPAPGRPPVGP